MKINIAVLFGGKTTEHEISIISAIQAINCMNPEKYHVIPIYISKTNEMYTGEYVADIEEYKNIPSLLKKSIRVVFANIDGSVRLMKATPSGLSKKVLDTVDMAFPIVHGTNVEDGSLRGYLNMFNLPVAGCDVISSAVGMDKYVMKAVLKDCGIPVLDCIRINSFDYNADESGIIAEIESKFAYPVIVKPVNLGSSIGINKAGDRESLMSALDDAFKFSDKILVERAVVNIKEINCSVVGDDISASASECEQPLSVHEILSYEDKYMRGGKRSDSKLAGGSKGAGMAGLTRKIPADISEEQREKIRNMAVNAFKAVGCGGVARIDFIIDMDTDDIYLNEINTIPGSLAFYLWEPLGVSYGELLDRIIKTGLDRRKRDDNLVFSFETNVLSGVKIGGKTARR